MINYTKKIAIWYGTRTTASLYAYFTGDPTQAQCEEADCLHPCYGAAYETNCSLCHQIAASKDAQESVTEEQFKKVCDSCNVPYEELEIPDKMTYNEFKTHV